jgi:23S rRNA pseudouridine1911/1915/1917 synthase
VIAKLKQRWTHLAKQFEAKPPKENMLLWFGEIHEEEGTIEGNLASLERPHANGCFADPEIGKPAVTHYKVLERFGYVTLISNSKLAEPIRLGRI